MSQYLHTDLLLPSFIAFTQILVNIHGMPVNDTKSAMKFLNRFGYISDKEMAQENLSMMDSGVQSNLKIFQKYAGLEPSGIIDKRTMQVMSQPRCGNKDSSVMRVMKKKNRLVGKLRSKRFATHSKWDKKLITYQLLNHPRCCINASTAEEEVIVAFRLWRNEIPTMNLRIRRRRMDDPQADIEIKFTTDPHEDNLSFGDSEDMYGRATAHAFYPLQDDPNDSIRGNIHFNDNENWTSGVPEGQNFLQTVTHEIGHALGLEHSMENDAVMFMRVLSFDKNFKLHQDDVQGIKALYDNMNTVDGELKPTNKLGSDAHPRQIFPVPPTPTNHKRKGWHCQKLIHNFGHTVMIAEQCMGDPDAAAEKPDSENELITGPN